MKIETILSTGEIELFGMTASAGQGTIDDYKRWIDLALQYNPNTRIMIGQSWMAGGPNLEEEKFERLTEMIAERAFLDVKHLRQSYQNQIFFVHYGFVGPQMKSAFGAGNLPDIEKLVGFGDSALFKDGKIGHAGPLLHELCAITWLVELYQANVTEISHSNFSHQAAQITRMAIQNNEQYR